MNRFSATLIWFTANAVSLLTTACGANQDSQLARDHSPSLWQFFRITGQDGVPLPRTDGLLTAQNEQLTMTWQLNEGLYSAVGIIPVVNQINGASGWFQTTAGPSRPYTLLGFRRDGATDTPFPPIYVPTVLVGGYPSIRITEQPAVACPNEVVRISWQVTGCSQVQFSGNNRDDRWECRPGPMETTVAVPATTSFTFQLKNSEDQLLPSGWTQVTVQVKPC